MPRPWIYVASLVLTACGGWGGGSKWIAEPLVDDEHAPSSGGASSTANAKAGVKQGTRTLGARVSEEKREEVAGGRTLGHFRNTYYDFPRETDHSGPTLSLQSASCKAIATVPRTFYETVCVQGSGSLKDGSTVSFAKRDCACAEICPRTGQRICFEALDKARFPWGRGASGKAITPLVSVAADTSILPMGTVLYIPELDGIAESDGCFVVEDRGLKVQGEHVDIFTGDPSSTAIVNGAVPSNQGVTIVVESPKCARLAKR